MKAVFAVSMLALLIAQGTSVAFAHGGADHAQQQKPVTEENAVVRFADVSLTNQHGQPVNLKRDLVSDRIVVMGFVYTTCTTVCPVVSSIMAKVQKQLGAKVGTDVQIVSITVDPLRDTPARLLSYANRFQNGPGWAWLTGTPQNIDATLKGLGTWTADPANHPPLIMVGDGRSSHWTRYYGFADPAQLVERVEQLRADRVAKPVKHGVYVMGDLP
ncbi:SCO family protein [Pseudomonas sp. NPDC090202]|uniref:SCO family protein n=1 Tax=unclassified Pseudomonas TaxID=196821 RepID=UPI003808A232